MTATIDGSVTRLIGDLKAGDNAAAEQLWDRYFERLVGLARARLRTAPRRGLDADEEDAALSAFHSLCRRQARGRFPLLSDRDDLWKLLVVLTVRKSLNQIEHQTACKRGGSRIVHETDFPPAGATSSATPSTISPAASRPPSSLRWSPTSTAMPAGGSAMNRSAPSSIFACRITHARRSPRDSAAPCEP